MCAAFGLPVQTPCVRLPRTAPLRGPAVPGVHAPEIRVLKLQKLVEALHDRMYAASLRGEWCGSCAGCRSRLLGSVFFMLSDCQLRF